MILSVIFSRIVPASCLEVPSTKSAPTKLSYVTTSQDPTPWLTILHLTRVADGATPIRIEVHTAPAFDMEYAQEPVSLCQIQRTPFFWVFLHVHRQLLSGLKAMGNFRTLLGLQAMENLDVEGFEGLINSKRRQRRQYCPILENCLELISLLVFNQGSYQIVLSFINNS